jgi:predicted DNA binding CopG/RHH family protein
MPTSAKKHRMVIPKFPSLKQEADWIDANRKKLEADISRRLRIGDTQTLADVLGKSASTETAKLKAVTIQMLSGDLDLLRRLATKKGLTYQAFVNALLRDALHRETRKSSSPR